VPPVSAWLLQCHHTVMRVRPALLSDAPEISELIYIAAASGYPNSGYDLSIGGTRPAQIAELTLLASTGSPSWFHFSHFDVLEVEGRIVAGAAGFDRARADEQLDSALLEAGWSEDRIAAMQDRLGPIFSALPPEPPGLWTIDHVAVMPSWRRRGFGRVCLQAVLERGKARGFSISKVDVFASNEPARALYKSLGFILAEIFDDPAFRIPLQRDPIERYITRLI
jgi:ribosomal protein S18 acetylase RimI-like enzyme